MHRGGDDANGLVGGRKCRDEAEVRRVREESVEECRAQGGRGWYKLCLRCGAREALDSIAQR